MNLLDRLLLWCRHVFKYSRFIRENLLQLGHGCVLEGLAIADREVRGDTRGMPQDHVLGLHAQWTIGNVRGGERHGIDEVLDLDAFEQQHEKRYLVRFVGDLNVIYVFGHSTRARETSIYIR